MLSKDVLKKLEIKFGIDRSNMTEKQKSAIIRDRLVSMKMAEETGKYVIANCWNTPDKKMRDTLAQMGILVEPEINFDVDKISNFLGIPVAEKSNLNINKIFAIIKTVDDSAKMVDLKDFLRKKNGNFENEEEAVKSWFSEKTL